MIRKKKKKKKKESRYTEWIRIWKRSESEGRQSRFYFCSGAQFLRDYPVERFLNANRDGQKSFSTVSGTSATHPFPPPSLARFTILGSKFISRYTAYSISWPTPQRYLPRRPRTICNRLMFALLRTCV